MTTQLHATPAAPPVGAPAGAPPAVPWPAPPGPGQVQPTPVVPRRPIGLWAACGVAVMASAAAVVLGGVAFKTAGRTAAPVSTTVTAPAPAPVLFDDSADRALCEAIPDLMRERNDADNAYQALPGGSPERNQAIPAYKASAQDWAKRVETVLAAHAQPDRYLTRTLQRYVDDVLLYTQNIYHNKPADRFDKPTWDVGVVDYGGALGRCNQLGVHWQD